MECKYFKIANFVLMLTLFSSCGYLENDRTEFQNNIIGALKVQKQENSNSADLVLQETEEIYSVIIENCSKVYLDSLNRRLFVESIFNKDSSCFFEIELNEKLFLIPASGIKKSQISEREFKNKVINKQLKYIFNK